MPKGTDLTKPQCCKSCGEIQVLVLRDNDDGTGSIALWNSKIEAYEVQAFSEEAIESLRGFLRGMRHGEIDK